MPSDLHLKSEVPAPNEGTYDVMFLEHDCNAAVERIECQMRETADEEHMPLDYAGFTLFIVTLLGALWLPHRCWQTISQSLNAEARAEMAERERETKRAFARSLAEGS